MESLPVAASGAFRPGLEVDKEQSLQDRKFFPLSFLNNAAVVHIFIALFTI